MATSTQTNTWEYLSGEYVTSPEARRIKIGFAVENGHGSAWLDKVRVDRYWPLISEITDTIGRKVTFDYDDTLYDEGSTTAGPLTITVKDPANTNQVVLTYDRQMVSSDMYFWIPEQSGTWYETRKFPYLYRVHDGESYKNYYTYQFSQELYNFIGGIQPGAPYVNTALLKELYHRNTKTVYNYTMTTKLFQTPVPTEFLQYQTYRINNRFENNYTGGGYSPTELNKQNYSYVGNYSRDGVNLVYDNECGYYNVQLFEDPNFFYTSTMQQDNGLTVKTTFRFVKEYKTEKILSGSAGERKITWKEEYHPTFKESPIRVKTESYNSAGVVSTLLTGYTYNDWGGVANETRPLTQAQWDNATEKTQNTINYSYDPTYKFITSKQYYQSPARQITETTNYDSLGRVTTAINAQGETTEHLYADAAHPGNVTTMKILHGDSRVTRTDTDYSGAYYAFPTTLTNYYTEEGTQKTSINRKNYEFIRGNLIREEDALGNATLYSYDIKGRVAKITHPASTGISGEYTVEDNFQYTLNDPVPELNNRYLFTVYQYETKTPAGQSPVTFNQSRGYYDDHGKLQLSRFFDYEKNQWAPTTYTYNNYGQLASFKDAQNNITGCALDSWDRLTRVTDPQSNYHDFQYDIAARTKTTTFTPYGGTAENHYIEGYLYNGHGDVVKVVDGSGNIVNNYSYDEWGNILSKTEGVNNPLKYAGEYFDDESGLIYLRARYYDPTVGRFISRDTVEGQINNPLSLNFYTYVENNPLIYIDPTGHMSEEVKEKVIEAIKVTFVSLAEAGVDAASIVTTRPVGAERVSLKVGSKVGNLVKPLVEKVKNLVKEADEVVPTIDKNTGEEIGRFIADDKGNIMIEPVGGKTVPAGKSGVDTHTTYPNGSNYQRLNPQGHGNNSTPHGHGHLPGTGPGMKGQGPSIDVDGNVVPWNSPDAHWLIY